jgi:hypothetical protein
MTDREQQLVNSAELWSLAHAEEFKRDIQNLVRIRSFWTNDEVCEDDWF